MANQSQQSPRRRNSGSQNPQELRHEAAMRARQLRAHAPRGARRAGSTPLWKRLRFFALLLLLAGLGQLVFAGLSSPRFRVADVSVSGIKITPEAAVARIEGSLVGQNWVRARLDAAQKELAALPTIESARISRTLHWPPQLHIEIKERAPFARVGAQNEWFVVDESGVPFRAADENDAKLFAVTSPNLFPKMGEVFAAKDWQPAARLVRALSTPVGSTPDASWNLRRVYLDKNGFASLRLQGGIHDEMLIRLGGDRWEEKLARARLATAYFERTNQRAKTLNLVSYTMPQWTPLLPVATAISPAQTAISPGT